MKKTHAKFQDNRYKTIRKGTHCLYTEGKKMTKFTMWKKENKSNNYIKKHMHTLIPWRKRMQRFKINSTKL